MALDLFSTNQLVAQVEDLRGRPAALSILSLLFPTIIEEASEEIHFDTENKPRRIAPFVLPTAAGRVVESQGFTASSFKPAYVKDKRTFDSERPLKRVMGEALTGNLSPEQRTQMLLAMDMMDMLSMLRRRKELMAIECLRTGQVTVSGEGFETKVVDFGRDAGLTIDLSGGAAEWDDPGISPVDNVEDWSLLMAEKSGAGASVAIFDILAWRLFKADAKFDKLVDQRRIAGVTPMDLGPRGNVGLQYRGTMGDIDLYTYSDWYVNDAGSEVKMIPDNTVILSSAAIEGAQCHGAIRDYDAGFAAMELFPKSWVQEDPSVRFLMGQSAPLVVPFRPNASFCATVT